VPNGANVTGFDIGLNCVQCGNGTSPPIYDSLVFNLAGYTSASFISADTAGYFFLADIGIPTGGGNFSTGYTGSFGGLPGGHGGQDVPEPASLAVLGTALVAFVGFVATRRRWWI
jgi:hypothetical protein